MSIIKIRDSLGTAVLFVLQVYNDECVERQNIQARDVSRICEVKGMLHYTLCLSGNRNISLYIYLLDN